MAPWRSWNALASFGPEAVGGPAPDASDGGLPVRHARRGGTRPVAREVPAVRRPRSLPPVGLRVRAGAAVLGRRAVEQRAGRPAGYAPRGGGRRFQTRTPTPTAWRSGAADGPWRARACATGTHGKARARGRPATRSRRPTRSWPITSAPSTAGRRIAYVFVRCDDSLHGPTLATSAPAPSPSTNLSGACGQATTSASLPSSRFPTIASERIGSRTLGTCRVGCSCRGGSRNRSSRGAQ